MTIIIIVVELGDIPFTTPDYIFNLQSWKPRLYSSNRKGPGVKDDDSLWNNYSYEPIESVKTSTTTGMLCHILIDVFSPLFLLWL